MPARPLDDWLEPLLTPAPCLATGGTLVLAASHGTAEAIRGGVIRRGGALGLEVATPDELAAIAAPAFQPDEQTPLPADNPMSERLRDRPGLAEQARRWVRWVRVLRAAALPHRCPAWLSDLADSRWGLDARTQQVAWLCEAVRRNGSRLNETHRFGRVVGRGFSVASGFRHPWEGWLAAQLDIPVHAPEPAPSWPIASWRVADPAEEARVAAQLALADPEGTVVVVSQIATRWRVADALRRNGLQPQHDTRLGGHQTPLGAAAIACASLLGPNAVDPSLEGLVQIARHWGPRPAGHPWRDRFAALELRLAPLRVWMKRAREFQEPQAADAVGILQALEAQAGPTHPRSLTDCLGAMLGGRTPSASQQSMLHALASPRSGSLTPTALRAALAGCGPPDALTDGVPVVMLDEWDGRPCRQVLLLDVHHLGLGRRDAPDPLLDPDEQRGLLAAPPEDRLSARIALAQSLAASADTVRAIVSERDASGRPLMVPLQLPLQVEQRTRPDLTALPEGLRRQQIKRCQGSAGDPPDGAHPLSIQTNLEWLRAGRYPHESGPSLGPYAALHERTQAAPTQIPDWARPWMGITGKPADPTRWPSRSATMAEHLNQCLYAAFSVWELGLNDPQPPDCNLVEHAVDAQLDAALDWARTHPPERVGPSELADARARAEAALQTLFSGVPPEDLTPIERVALAEELRRWQRGWFDHQSRRIAPPAARIRDTFELGPFVQGHPDFEPVLRVARDTFPDVADGDLRIWLSNTGARIAQGTNVVRDSDAFLCQTKRKRGAIPMAYAERAREWVRAGGLAPVATLWASAWRRDGLRTRIAGPPWDPPNQAVAIPIGPHRLSLEGPLPRVVPTQVGRHTAVELTLHETGPRPDRTAWQQAQELWSTRDTELVLELLRLRAFLEAQGMPAGIVSARRDWVQHSQAEAPILVDGPTLDRMADRIQVLLDAMTEGRWALHPVPSRCPALGGFGARCPAQGACRLRDLPEAP